MCKDNYAVIVNMNTPSCENDDSSYRCYMPIISNYYSTHSLILLFTLTYMRRIFNYTLSEVFEAQAPEGRCQDCGTGPQWNAQPASRSDRRPALPEQPILRSARSSTSPLRNAAPASHRAPLDRGDDAGLRRFSPHVLSRSDRVYRARSRRLATAIARPQEPPQAFRRSSPTCSRFEERRPNSHNHEVHSGDSTAIWYQRASSQPRTCTEDKKNTAHPAATQLIPAHAGEDYEVLRDQLFGIVRPGVPVAGFGGLIRCGLAAWASERGDRTAQSTRAPLPLGPTPAEHVPAGSLLVKLIASLILRPRQEVPRCQT
jgi:hypothetical protein